MNYCAAHRAATDKCDFRIFRIHQYFPLLNYYLLVGIHNFGLYKRTEFHIVLKTFSGCPLIIFAGSPVIFKRSGFFRTNISIRNPSDYRKTSFKSGAYARLTKSDSVHGTENSLIHYVDFDRKLFRFSGKRRS